MSLTCLVTIDDHRLMRYVRLFVFSDHYPVRESLSSLHKLIKRIYIECNTVNALDHQIIQSSYWPQTVRHPPREKLKRFSSLRGRRFATKHAARDPGNLQYGQCSFLAISSDDFAREEGDVPAICIFRVRFIWFKSLQFIAFIHIE